MFAWLTCRSQQDIDMVTECFSVSSVRSPHEIIPVLVGMCPQLYVIIAHVITLELQTKLVLL